MNPFRSILLSDSSWVSGIPHFNLTGASGKEPSISERMAFLDLVLTHEEAEVKENVANKCWRWIDRQVGKEELLKVALLSSKVFHHVFVNKILPELGLGDDICIPIEQQKALANASPYFKRLFSAEFKSSEDGYYNLGITKEAFKQLVDSYFNVQPVTTVEEALENLQVGDYFGLTDKNALLVLESQVSSWNETDIGKAFEIIDLLPDSFSQTYPALTQKMIRNLANMMGDDGLMSLTPHKFRFNGIARSSHNLPLVLENLPKESITDLELISWNLSDKVFTEELFKFVNLKCLELKFLDKPLNLYGLKDLKSLEKVDLLCISTLPSTYDDIESLVNLREFKTFKNRLIDDLSIAKLALLPKLGRLTLLSCEKLTNECCKYFKRMINLHTLEITGTNGLSKPGIKALSECPQIKHLSLNCSEHLTDEDCAPLENMINLESLSLRSLNQLTDRTFQSLAKCRNLKKLDLSDTNITNTGVSFLSTLENLEELNLERCSKVTLGGTSHINKRCKVVLSKTTPGYRAFGAHGHRLDLYQ